MQPKAARRFDRAVVSRIASELWERPWRQDGARVGGVRATLQPGIAGSESPRRSCGKGEDVPADCRNEDYSARLGKIMGSLLLMSSRLTAFPPDLFAGLAERTLTPTRLLNAHLSTAPFDKQALTKAIATKSIIRGDVKALLRAQGQLGLPAIPLRIATN
jgi:hypothetical protein